MSDISMNEDRGEDPGHGQGGGADPFKGEVEAARDKLSGVAHTLHEEVAHVSETTKDKASEKIEQTKETIATAIGDFAEAIRKAGDELAEKDQTMVAGLVTQAADGLEAFSHAASEKSPEQMLNVVREFGRSNPGAFLAGSVLAGLALGRFARSSAGHDHPSNGSPSRRGVTLSASSSSYSAGTPASLDTGVGTGIPGPKAEPVPMVKIAGASVLGESPRQYEPSQTEN